MKEILYQETVGSLMYAVVATRLDLAFAVNVVSRFILKPGLMHFLCWRGGGVVVYQTTTDGSTIYNEGGVHGNEPMHEGGYLA